jgi:RNA polymerase sigma factor (sigma-70 family)
MQNEAANTYVVRVKKMDDAGVNMVTVEVPVTEEVYRTIVQSVWREKKHIERDRRCNLGKKRCNERCDECNYYKTHITTALISLDGYVETCGDCITDGENVENIVLMVELNDVLHNALKSLDKISYQIIIGLFYKRQTEREIADMLGITQVAVNKRKKKALEALRKMLKDFKEF